MGDGGDDDNGGGDEDGEDGDDEEEEEDEIEKYGDETRSVEMSVGYISSVTLIGCTINQSNYD